MEAGAIIDIRQSPAAYPRSFYTTRLYPGGGTLIVSNNPEEVNGQGILYQDVMRGSWRVFVHHQNKTGSEPGGTPQAIRLLIRLRNLQDRPVSLLIERSGAACHAEPQAAGYQALLQYLYNDTSASLVLQPGASTCLGVECLAFGDTFAGIYDFISRIALETSVISLYQRNEELPAEELTVFKQHIYADGSFTIRGTFPYRQLSGTFVHFAGGVWRGAQLGNNPYGNYLRDSWWDWDWSQVYYGEYPAGWSALDFKPVFNWGNYGVFYHIRLVIEHKPESPQETQLLFNPRGGTYYGPIQVDNQIIESNRPIAPIDEALLIDTVRTAQQGRQYRTVSFMPPGGASLPVRILAGARQ